MRYSFKRYIETQIWLFECTFKSCIEKNEPIFKLKTLINSFQKARPRYKLQFITPRSTSFRYDTQCICQWKFLYVRVKTSSGRHCACVCQYMAREEVEWVGRELRSRSGFEPKKFDSEAGAFTT